MTSPPNNGPAANTNTSGDSNNEGDGAPAADPAAKPASDAMRSIEVEGEPSAPVETIGADPRPAETPAQPSPSPNAAPNALAETTPLPGARAAAPGVETKQPAPDIAAPAPQPATAPSAPLPHTQAHTSQKPPINPTAVHFSLPNILTLSRCGMVLLILILLVWPWGPFMTGALFLFGLAALTDWLDGLIARTYNLTSDLGRMLDHIADKLLVGVTMLALCAIGVIDGLNVIAAASILAREIAISGLREHLGGKGIVVEVTQVAKWKTTFQMVALAALMAAPLAPIEFVARLTGLMILWIAMVMTLVSGAQYIWGTRHAWDRT
ncbi:MAG: CDP-diacylglycerol--glycerol-3-phosphate 3-phosphatidyltransferase [Pseudomonadota bacterium]